MGVDVNENTTTNSSLTEPLIVATTTADEEEGSTTLLLEGEEVTDNNHVIAVTDDGVQRGLLQLDEDEWEHGEVQNPMCRDLFFAILFVIQLLVVLTFSGIGIVSASSIINKYKDEFNTDDDTTHDDNDPSFDGQNVAYFALLSIGSAIGISGGLMLLLLGPLANMMIQVTLLMGPITNFVASVLFFVYYNNVMMGCVTLVMCAFSVCYAYMVWRRIPFAAANIATAMEALHENKGIFPLAYLVTIVATVWVTLWAIAVANITIQHKDWIYTTVTCTNNNTDYTLSSPEETDCTKITPGGYAIFFGLLLNLYWTSQVIGNCFHTTIAGVVGTWWFTTEEDRPKGCCTSTIYDCWVRTNIYSFGSICLGSLVVAILRVLHVLVSMGRNNNQQNGGGGGAAIFWCLLECIVNLLEQIIEYLNHWAFVYVGLYGYDYITSGKKVIELFKSRGWTIIINDNLVHSAFSMLQFWIGIISGGVGAISGKMFLEASTPWYAGAIFGFVLGLLFSSILFSVVNSAVDTVVVCFAESPNSLRFNHPPEISNKMITAWKEVYPDECGCW
eukprot:CAMPEP_0194135602 /NCGR_PEP_ID=MMETSP0152-20130528/5702_1 /TAXON_ID=1049557 /ORGANISM="Thalassiothrix antarctica, Strain L6-D1" /LENGTH=558 /DNA_ID=CAMNT_0038831921 /DNA_START=51 /DNA_END=1727 /DNA_ORIENTATION=-